MKSGALEVEPILIMKCYACGRTLYPSDREKGISCKCGSLHMQYTNPTLRRRIQHIWHETPGSVFAKLKELWVSEVVSGNS